MQNTELEIQELNLSCNTQRPLIITGPCSAETEEQLLSTAKALAAQGFELFRAGVWKPRTRPGGFEGIGNDALIWLESVKQETGMLIGTEVATPQHVEAALKHNIDFFWIGARTSANPFAMQAIAESLKGVDIPVFVKNPVNPDLDLWIGALQRLNQVGIKQLGAIHRGFSHYAKHIYRNLPMWHIPIELHRRIPQLPIVCDPSHIGGSRELIYSISQQSMDLGFDGLIIESHCNPDYAWSDANQQVTPYELKGIVERLVVREQNTRSEVLHQLRAQIDELDDQLMEILSNRFKVCREIGRHKKQENITVLQSNRYKEIRSKIGTQAADLEMSADFAARIIELIHEESIRQQLKILNT